MVVIRLILLLTLVTFGVLLGLGNVRFLTITVLGMQTLPLPLWGLLLGAMALGGLSGVLLQRILDLQPRSDGVKRRSTVKKKPKKSPSPKPKSKVAPKSKSRSPQNPRPSVASGMDWNAPIGQDWFDQPPSTRQAPRPNYRYDRMEEDVEPSIARPSSPGSDRVVDADYRVLRSPYEGQPYNAPPDTPRNVQQPKTRRSDDEWDDEFFDDD